MIGSLNYKYKNQVLEVGDLVRIPPWISISAIPSGSIGVVIGNLPVDHDVPHLGPKVEVYFTNIGKSHVVCKFSLEKIEQ